ncbi:MAG: DNA recombination protein RmuC, partial [Clostridiales bacterium]
EDYQRLIEAQDNADVAAVDASRKALENALKKSAKSIHDKYINPPKTLEYAVLFLPTEGLFAEALRLPGFMEYAQEQCQIMVAGPTNLAALLNSIKLGFRTLAIQEKSGEIRKLLGAIKTDMNKFEIALEKIQKKISEADKTLADATDRTRIISKKLNKVEAISTEETAELLDE